MSDVIDELEDVDGTPDTQVLEETLEIPKERLQSFRECVAGKMKEGMSMAEAGKACKMDAGKEEESKKPEETVKPTTAEPKGKLEESAPKKSEELKDKAEDKGKEKESEKTIEDLSTESILKQMDSMKAELMKRGKYPQDSEKEKMSSDLKETKEKLETLSQKIEFLENKGQKMTKTSGLEKLSERAKERTYFSGKDGSIWSWDE